MNVLGETVGVQFLHLGPCAGYVALGEARVMDEVEVDVFESELPTPAHRVKQTHVSPLRSDDGRATPKRTWFKLALKLSPIPKLGSLPEYFVVTHSSSLRNPLKWSASPVSRSFLYACAVSTWSNPAPSAWSTCVMTVSPDPIFHVPKPIAGMARPSFSLIASHPWAWPWLVDVVGMGMGIFSADISLARSEGEGGEGEGREKEENEASQVEEAYKSR